MMLDPHPNQNPMAALDKLEQAERLIREARALALEAGARPLRMRLDGALGTISVIKTRAYYRPRKHHS